MSTTKLTRINILYLIDHFHGVGGTENHLARLVTSLDKGKFSCTIVAFDFVDNHLSDTIKQNGVELIHLPVGRYYTVNALKNAVYLTKIIRDKRIDIVQTFHIKSDFYGSIVARLSGVKYILSSKRDVGDLKSSWHFFLNKLVRGITCKYIAVADAVKKAVIEKEGVSTHKITTIYNGVDKNIFNAPSFEEKRRAKKKLGFSDSDFVVGTVAWLRPEKNYIFFFDSIINASNQVNNLKAVAVGGDEDGQQLKIFKNYVDQAGISENVIFAGQVPDVKKYLKAFDIACLVPSGNEGFSNSIIEKMAMGLPMIVSDVGGNAEAVIDGYNGFVIPPNNSEKLTEALVYLAEHPEERKKMGDRSAQRVQEMFTLEGMIQAHEELYESLIAG